MSATGVAVPTRTRTWIPPWAVVVAAMFCVGWGGNQFTPLLIAYRQRSGYSAIAVDIFLGAYVLGLIPGLLVASALSDRHGRRPVLLAGLALSIAGSAALAVGAAGPVPIIVGRLLSGVAIGVAMAVGSSWVKELSGPAFDPAADAGSGARRAATGLTLGLGIGPGVAGVLAQWAPWPLVLSYLVQIVLSLPVWWLLFRRGVETRDYDGSFSLRSRLRVPLASHRRFRWVVLPMAPWIFSTAAVAYAIIPQQVGGSLGNDQLIFAAALTVCTLATGVAVQPLARRLDSVSSARAIVVALALITVGMAAAAVAVAVGAPWLGFVVAVLLGAAYGIAVVSGLLEIQRIARADDLAGLTGVFYALAYVGFLLPTLLAALARWVSYPVMLSVLALLGLGCARTVASRSTRHLP